MKLTKQFIQFENGTQNSSRTLPVGNAQYEYLKYIYKTSKYI